MAGNNRPTCGKTAPSGAALFLLAPLLFAIALLVKLTSPGPVFYRAGRIGQGGRRFRLFKFRSMAADAAQSVISPGITSPASVRYRSEEQMLTGPDWESQYVNVILPDKLRIELEYLKHRTLFWNLRIILETALALFR